MQEAEHFMASNAFELNSTNVLQFVQHSDCSSYDCEYVALADDLEVQLVTFDQQICREFSAIVIHPETFVS